MIDADVHELTGLCCINIGTSSRGSRNEDKAELTLAPVAEGGREFHLETPVRKTSNSHHLPLNSYVKMIYDDGTSPPPRSIHQFEQIIPDEKHLLESYPAHLINLATTILYNLRYQHDWTHLVIYLQSPVTHLLLPRPLVAGVPPKRVYVHPDEQIEILKAEHMTGQKIEQHPEPEWVLPTYIGEKFTLDGFAQIFDSIDTLPPFGNEVEVGRADDEVGQRWRGKSRQKRILLSTLHDDSTVTYYIMHDGIVKPRQN